MFITRPEGQLTTPERPPHKETEYVSMDFVLRKVHFYTVLFQIPTCNVVCFVKVQIILENSLRGGCCWLLVRVLFYSDAPCTSLLGLV